MKTHFFYALTGLFGFPQPVYHALLCHIGKDQQGEQKAQEDQDGDGGQKRHQRKLIGEEPEIRGHGADDYAGEQEP